MSLGIVVDESKEEVPSSTQEDREQIIKKEMDQFIAVKKNPGFTWKGEHSFELGDDPIRMTHFGHFTLYAQPVIGVEPSSTTTTTTTTTSEPVEETYPRLGYNPSNLCEHEWRPVTSVEEVD
jgi:hypothetical protein